MAATDHCDCRARLLKVALTWPDEETLCARHLSVDWAGATRRSMGMAYEGLLFCAAWGEHASIARALAPLAPTSSCRRIRLMLPRACPEDAALESACYDSLASAQRTTISRTCEKGSYARATHERVDSDARLAYLTARQPDVDTSNRRTTALRLSLIHI